MIGGRRRRRLSASSAIAVRAEMQTAAKGTAKGSLCSSAVQSDVITMTHCDSRVRALSHCNALRAEVDSFLRSLRWTTKSLAGKQTEDAARCVLTTSSVSRSESRMGRIQVEEARSKRGRALGRFRTEPLATGWCFSLELDANPSAPHRRIIRVLDVLRQQAA